MVCICNFIVVDFDSILSSVSNTILVKLHSFFRMVALPRGKGIFLPITFLTWCMLGF